MAQLLWNPWPYWYFDVLLLLILLTLMMEAIHSSEMSVLQEPHGVTSWKMAFFILPTTKTSESYKFKREV
jgi:hypothetical protein